MAVSKSRNVKKTNKVVKKNKPVQNIIDIEVDEEEQKPLFDDIVPEPVPEVKHSYDDKNGYFIAEKEDGQNLEIFIPSVLPSEYCIIAKKFIDVNTAISVGNHCAGTHKSMDYKEFEALDDNSVDSAHCYNIVSDFGVDRLQMVLSKLKHGGKCLVTDEKSDLSKVVNNMVGIYTRVCGYGYKLFNHRYWFDHKNISIALIIKG